MRFCILALTFLLSRPSFTFPDYDVRGNRTENFLEMQGRVSLKLDKMHYKIDEEILAEVTIKNYGNEPLRIFPTMYPLQTYQFLIVDENDETLLPNDKIYISDKKLERRNRVVNLVGDAVKEIILHKGESITKRFNLREYYNFTPGKKYYVASYFYPNYVEDSQTFLRSENYSLFVVEPKKSELPPRRAEPYQPSETELTPEEVIHLFLSAEMKRNWENYFKYLELSEFIHAYPKFSKEFANADSDYQALILDEFKKFLITSSSGRLINYKITKRINPHNSLAKVYVQVERELNRYPTKYEYIYVLKKGTELQKGFWKISNVIVKVIR